MNQSPLQKGRYSYSPKLPPILTEHPGRIQLSLGEPTDAVEDRAELRERFPNTYGMPMVEIARGDNPHAAQRMNVGVILSGGQAPGGHNVIAGLFDAIKRGNQDSMLFGFLGGPSGIIEDRAVELTADRIESYRNTGGFDMIGSGRTKLETEAQFETCAEVCRRRGVGALVIIGGDDSNTNAAVLAEYFQARKIPITVVGVPKTIDGDLKTADIESSFGFDTATKTYSELIGNIERDAASAGKYWHFIRLMGRSASHITLECALKTRPNLAIISEEIQQENRSLAQIVDEVAAIVAARAEGGENFGVVLVPEGLIEFIPEMGRLIEELNSLLARKASEFGALASTSERIDWTARELSPSSSSLFTSLPAAIQSQLLADRDPHGNVQVSRIETETLLIEMIDGKLKEMRKAGRYQGKFSALHHFFGYEGRCAFPSNFDADYCYALGYNAYLLAASGKSGYMSIIKNLSHPAEEWTPGGLPITMLFNLERRHGELRPVIKKALVDLQGAPFNALASSRAKWARETSYLFPGAIQYWGPAEICDRPTETLLLERAHGGSTGR